MNDIYLYHHLGLGDHISCHGIVRSYCEKYEKVNLFVKENNYKNVSYMYNDIKNINFLIGDDDYAQNYLANTPFTNMLSKESASSSVRKIGFNLLSNSKNFELQFYEMAGVPFEYKYDKFYINRDMDREMELFNSLGIKEGEYIFIHSGDAEIKEDVIKNKDLKRISPDTHMFFDWIYVIENAKEIHCMDSSFLCLIDCLNLKKDIELFNHRYIRNYPDHIKIGTNKDWKFIK